MGYYERCFLFSSLSVWNAAALTRYPSWKEEKYTHRKRKCIYIFHKRRRQRKWLTFFISCIYTIFFFFTRKSTSKFRLCDVSQRNKPFNIHKWFYVNFFQMYYCYEWTLLRNKSNYLLFGTCIRKLWASPKLSLNLWALDLIRSSKEMNSWKLTTFVLWEKVQWSHICLSAVMIYVLWHNGNTVALAERMLCLSSLLNGQGLSPLFRRSYCCCL